MKRALLAVALACAMGCAYAQPSIVEARAHIIVQSRDAEVTSAQPQTLVEHVRRVYDDGPVETRVDTNDDTIGVPANVPYVSSVGAMTDN